MSEVRSWGGFRRGPAGPTALYAMQAFPEENDLPGEFSSPGQMKDAGPRRGPWPAGASAGTQAEDALTMKRLYQAACG